jgi:hypothetical protein
VNSITPILIAGRWALRLGSRGGFMAGIDEVLERLLTDAQFGRHLAQDPASALAGYELTADDLTLLSTQVSFDPGALSLVEERISKSSFFGLLTSITGGLAGGGNDLGPSPHMSPGVVAPVDLEEVIGPSDSEGVVAPVDSEGVVGHGDVQVPAVQSPDGGSIGGGGAGSEVSIKEVDPAPQPSAEAHGTGGGAGSEVSIKEVDPAPQPSAESDGVVVQGGTPAPDGIIVQGGMPAPDGIIVQGGMTPPDGTIGLSEADGVAVADGVVVQGGLTGPGETEGVTYPI